VFSAPREDYDMKPRKKTNVNTCVVCGSTRILRCDTVTAESGFGGGPVRIVRKQRLGGDSIRLKGAMLIAFACVDCGDVGLQAVDFDELRQAFDASPQNAGSKE
jgi:hypothetical protein